MAIGAISPTFVSQVSSTLMRGADGLTPDQQAQVQKLKAADQKVRQHEAAHQSAGAGLTGGATYQYVRGPDGRQYAVAGEVSINTSPAGTPEATLVKARQIRAAALAPADPSPQDRAVAAAASLMESQARAEISRKREEDQQSTQSHLSGMQDLQVNAKSRSADQATRAYGAAVQAVTEALGQAISTYA